LVIVGGAPGAVGEQAGQEFDGSAFLAGVTSFEGRDGRDEPHTGEGQVTVGFGGAHDRGHGGADGGGQGLVGGSRDDRGFEERGGVVVEHDVFLGGEVAVEGGGGGLGGLDDLLDGGVLVALGLEEAQGRGLDGAA
jgi:hypothetical protein